MCSFEPEIIEIGLSSHMMYSNNIVNFQESTTILNACTKKVWKPIEGTTILLLGRKRTEIRPSCQKDAEEEVVWQAFPEFDLPGKVIRAELCENIWRDQRSK